METRAKANEGPWLRRLHRLDSAVERLERTILAYGVILMAVVSIANVAGRNLLGESIAFAGEVNQVLIILITFMGIGYGVRHARHIRMSALYDQLRGRWRKGLLVLTSFATAALLLILAWYALQYVLSVWRVGSVSPALQVPLYLFYAWVPLGFLLGSLQYLLAGVRNLTTPGTHLSFQRAEAYAEPGEEEHRC